MLGLSLRGPGALVLLCFLGGCGLLLDARPATDAAVAPDAPGMDAARMDASVPADAGSLDAFEPRPPDARVPNLPDASLLDANLPDANLPDAVTPGPDAAVPSTDAPPSRPDAIVDPALTDAGLDALPMTAPDAGPRDAGRPDSGYPDVGAALRDAGRDAGHDAGRPTCLTDSDCPPMTLAGNTCQDRTCAAGMCVPRELPFVCPPAGTCARACARNATGEAECRREGTNCSPLLGACDSTEMCIGAGAGGAGVQCVPFSSCPVHVCLPGCTGSGTSCTFTIDAGTTVGGVCTGGVCTPTGFLPAWCAGP